MSNWRQSTSSSILETAKIEWTGCWCYMSSRFRWSVSRSSSWTQKSSAYHKYHCKLFKFKLSNFKKRIFNTLFSECRHHFIFTPHKCLFLFFGNIIVFLKIDYNSHKVLFRSIIIRVIKIATSQLLKSSVHLLFYVLFIFTRFFRKVEFN